MTSFEITFTLDTICPESEDGKQASFVVKYMPYQLYPDQAPEAQEKREFYKTTPYAGTEERLKMYSTYMSALGVAVGINFSFDGWVANTFNAHRLIQYVQEEKGSQAADKVINSLYKQYFEQEKSPSADDTLIEAIIEAGLGEDEYKSVVNDKNEHLVQTRSAIREQAGNGVDSVPSIIFEGRRRDITLVGAKEIAEYEKTLHQIVRESR